MLYQLPKPPVIAHRGASLYAPENTLPAFQLAILQGADAIELDVKLSADGQVVVIHDQTIDPTTGEHG
jgi:glycerophosphoryl diester phosphodiesterase